MTRLDDTLASASPLARCVLAATLALAVLLDPGGAAADDVRVDDGSGAAADDDGTAEDSASRWSINFTPVLIFPDDEYGWGGGTDPELKYTLDFGGVLLSAGGRLGGYYAKNSFGMTAMPTLRVAVPVGSFEPYVSGGVGYGWIPELDHADFARMARLGTVIRFSKSFSLGVEGTLQDILNSKFRFPSLGSMVSIEL